jgi:hypothetical protein
MVKKITLIYTSHATLFTSDSPVIGLESNTVLCGDRQATINNGETNDDIKGW